MNDVRRLDAGAVWVSFRMKSRRDLLTMSIAARDPLQTLALRQTSA
jgi:hypothetical protein